MRIFNIAGPVNPKKHYYVPHRLDEQFVLSLVEQEQYFILHAPRQSGKTTAIRIFVDILNASGKYRSFYVNVEPAQVARSNVERGMKSIVNLMLAVARKTKSPKQFLQIAQSIRTQISDTSLFELLQQWSMESDKPIILFIDEIDSLIGDTLISVLRQLRAGYADRPAYFPQSVCLIGVRDVRDYRIWSDEQHNMVLGGSAFNIKAESLVLQNFSFEQVRNLYAQHTQETGQQFTEEAIEHAFYLTQGQPWLVNALARQACRDVINRTQPIAKGVIERAKETLILRRDTHLDALIDRLKEPRVLKIIDAIVSGTGEDQDFKVDDIQYARDLGLIGLKGLVIANPIYQEIIPRELAYSKQESIAQQTAPYKNTDGSLNMRKLLEAFVQFYRENSGVWLKDFAYKESGPHLLLMAFLQRIINGGGKIHREYALGSKRVDLFIEWPAGNQRIVIEMKIKRDQKTIPDGLTQTAEYMDINNATEGHLVVFDRDTKKKWEEKISVAQQQVGKDSITIWCL